MRKFKTQQELDIFEELEEIARRKGIITNQDRAKTVAPERAEYHRNVSKLLTDTQAALEGCTQASPCRVPLCVKCSSRVQYRVRRHVANLIIEAVHLRARYYLPVTFTSADWVQAYSAFPIEPAVFVHELIQHLREHDTFKGGWFALDIKPFRPRANLPPLPSWNVHVHGVIVSKSRKKASNLLREFTRDRAVRSYIEREYLSPSDTKDFQKVVTQDQIKYWVRYCDRRNTQRVSSVVDNVLAQAIMHGGTRHFAFGELASADAGRVFAERLNELSDQIEEIQPHLTRRDGETAVQLVAELRVAAKQYSMGLRQLASDNSSCPDAVMFIGEAQKEITTSLYRLAISQTAELESLLFQSVGDGNALVRHLRVGALIRSIRQRELFLEPNPGIVAQLEPLNGYWPAHMPEEADGDLDTGRWLRSFARHFAAAHLKGVVAPVSQGQFIRRLEETERVPQKGMIKFLLRDVE